MMTMPLSLQVLYMYNCTMYILIVDCSKSVRDLSKFLKVINPYFFSSTFVLSVTRHKVHLKFIDYKNSSPPTPLFRSLQ